MDIASYKWSVALPVFHTILMTTPQESQKLLKHIMRAADEVYGNDYG